MGGFSTSGATVIILIGAIIAAGMVIPAVDDATSDTGHALSEQQDRLVETKNTDFNVIIAEIDEPPTDQQEGEMTVELENTGTKTFKISKIDTQIDGVLVDPDETTVDGDETREYVAPGETLEATYPISEEPDRVHVTVETGQSEWVVVQE